jgi:hypothetical protein
MERFARRNLDDLGTPEGLALSGGVISRHLGVAMNELSGVDRQMPPDLDPRRDAVRVPCPFCGAMIMPSGTLCGLCWRRRYARELVEAGTERRSPT